MMRDHEQAASEILDGVFAFLKPPAELSISEWSDEFRRLPPEVANGGRYRTARTPYLKEVMDACADPNTREVWVMKSAQVGFTELINNVVGYYSAHKPSSILVALPRVEDAEIWSKEKFAPMIRESPVLSHAYSEAKGRNESNTIRYKRFKGGWIAVIGVESPRALRMRSGKVVCCDEVDAYTHDSGGEGDPVSLLRKRQTTFHDRVFLAGGTPKTKDDSTIEKGYESGDRRQYHVPCPHCGHEDIFRWEDLDFSNKGSINDPVIECKSCNELMHDRHKSAMLKKGRWIAERNFHGVASFRISQLYSPWVSWAETVREFLRLKRIGPEGIKAFKNTVLGETYLDNTTNAEPQVIETRERFMSFQGNDLTIPDEVLFVTFGCDVQDDRIEMEIVGWAEEQESYSLDYIVHTGRFVSNPVQDKIIEVYKREYKTVSGYTVPMLCGGIDSGDGDVTHAVYAFCKPFMKTRGGILPFKGSNSIQAPAWSMPAKPSRKERDRIKPYMIGVSQLKKAVMDRLQIPEPGPRYCHFPSHYERRYFEGITAERLVTEYNKGRYPQKVWKKIRDYNEPLDCRVYALAAQMICSNRIPQVMALREREMQMDLSNNYIEKPQQNREKQGRSPVSFQNNRRKVVTRRKF